MNDRKEYYRQWYQDNKEHKKKYSTEYQRLNKDKKKVQNKKYRDKVKNEKTFQMIKDFAGRKPYTILLDDIFNKLTIIT